MAFNQTDLGHAQRLQAAYPDHLRYLTDQETWLYWTGQHWQRDSGGAKLVQGWAKLMRHLQREPEGENLKEQDKFRAWATRNENMARIKAMREAAATLPGWRIEAARLDADPWLLGTPGGTVELRTGTLRAPRPADLISHVTRAAPDFAAEIPVWQGFLQRIFAGNEELIGSVRRLLGYCLTGQTSEQILAIFYGTGANGKSTLLDAVVHVMGEYATPGAPGVLESHDQERHPSEIADLMGRRLVTLTETDRGVRFSEGLVKRITGETTLKGRFMRQDWFEFPVTFKLIYAVNHSPMLAGADHGIKRRIMQIPFTVRISEEERDRALGDKLRAEAPGILAWLVQGCLEYQRGGLAPCRAVREATRDYLALQDTIGDFLTDCTEPGEGIAAAALYQAWAEWARGHGEKEISHKLFSLKLLERGLERERGGYERGWIGLSLKARDHHDT